LNDVAARAVSQNLALRAAAHDIDLARAGLVEAGLWPLNPELAGGAGLRMGPEEMNVDVSAGLSQAFELGRPRRHRVRAAQAAVAVAEAQWERQRLEVVLEAKEAFLRAVAAEQLVRLSDKAALLARELHRVAQERLAADAATELEVNLAALEWAQAQRSLARARLQAAQDRLALALVLSLPLTEELALPRHLPEAATLSSDEDHLVERALARRTDLLSLARRRDEAAAQLAQARAEAAPELAVEAGYELEEGQDHIVGLGLSLSLPLFHRNQGAIAAARARVDQAELEEEAGRLAVAHQVRAALVQYRAAWEVSEAFGRDTLERHERNLELLQASFDEGAVNLVEVLLMQRELLLAWNDAVAAAVELHLARAAVERAVGEEVP
jgi:cobalt-zinc-cadmium efflux system outer membrane protein